MRRARLATPSPQTPGEPLSRAELAELVNAWIYRRTGRAGAVTASYIGKLERGIIRWPQRDYRDALRAVLHASTDRDLGLRRPQSRGVHRSWDPAVDAPGPGIDGAPALGSPGAGADAPGAVDAPGLAAGGAPAADAAGAGGAPAAGSPGSPGASEPAGPGGPGAFRLPPSWFETVELANAALRADRLDASMIQAYEQTAQELAAMYRGADPRAILPMAIAFADHLLDVLGASATDADQMRLAAVTVGVHAEVGLWACHSDRPGLAYRYLAAACQVADGTGDAGLRSRALGSFGYLFSSAPRGGRGGDPGRSLRLLDQALDTVGRGDAFTRGWLATWRADQHATLGELDAARGDVEAAACALDGADRGPDGFFSRATYGYGIGAHLDSVRGVVEALAGDGDAADATLARARRSAANMRRAIATAGDAAMAHAWLRNPEEACEILGQSITMTLRIHYPMGLRRAVGVRSGFDPSWDDLPCVRELDELFGQSARGRLRLRDPGAGTS
jgi:hypothetical protein